MENQYKFITPWPETTNIGWQINGRRSLNKVIDAFNQWQIDGFGDATTLLALIEHGKQTYAAQDGGSGYMDELETMLHFINQRQCG